MPPSRFIPPAHPGGSGVGWGGKFRTITARSPVWLRWESHKLSSMPMCGLCQRCKANGRGPCERILLMLARSHSSYPSAVTPALLHKVNLPLKTCYLLTRLIEVDGCMTFIEYLIFFFPLHQMALVLTPRIRSSTLLGCYMSWTPAPAEIAHKHAGRRTETQRWLEICAQPWIVDWNCWTAIRVLSFSPYKARSITTQPHHIIIMIRSKWRTCDDSFTLHK